jgi:hypothetical protein
MEPVYREGDGGWVKRKGNDNFSLQSYLLRQPLILNHIQGEGSKGFKTR